MLPIGDAPNPRSVPYVTYLLIAANVAVFVLVTIPLAGVPPSEGDPVLAEYVRVMSRTITDPALLQQALAHVSQYDLFVFTHGFRPIAPSVADVFASMFLHAGFAHLAGNMLFLWIYGDNVEHRLGALRYLGGYLGTGVAAALFQTALAPDSPLPMVGASGAISGVLGFYFVWFPRNHVRILMPPLMQVVLIPSRLVLGLYLVADNLLPLLAGGGLGGVAHGAHIGGFLAGLGASWFLDRRELTARPPEYRRDDGAPAAPGDVGAAIRDGRFADAAAEYFSLSPGATRRLLAPQDSLALAEWLRRNGHSEGAMAVLRRHLRDFPRGPGVADAHVAAGDVLLEDLDQPTSAYQHFMAALDEEPPPGVALAARRGIGAVEALQKRQIGRPRVRRAP